GARRRRVQAVLLRPIAATLAEVHLHFGCRCIGVLETGPRVVPVKVRVGQLERVPAVLAVATGRVGIGAEHRLGKVEREALLADASRTMEEEARRERTLAGSVLEAGAQGVVAEEGE